MTIVWGALIVGIITSVMIWTTFGLIQLVAWLGEKYWLSR